MSERTMILLQSQIVSAAIEKEAMVCANVSYRMNYRGSQKKYQPPYSPEDFRKLIDQYSLGWNSVITLINEN